MPEKVLVKSGPNSQIYRVACQEKLWIGKYKNILYMKCACCGGNMLLEKELEKIVIYKCRECGLSNTEVKKNDISSRKWLRFD